MKFETYLQDASGNEWSFHCELSGTLDIGEYDSTNPNSNQTVIAYTLGTIKFLDIILRNGNELIHVDSIGGMPDQFSQKAVNDLETECREALEEDLKFNEFD